MSFWKRSMEYLGLGPDDAYDDYDDGPEPEPPSRQRHRDDHSRSSSRTRGRRNPIPARSVPFLSRPSFPSRDFESGRRSAAPGRRRSGHVRPPPDVLTLGGAAPDRRAGDGSTASLRSGARAGRPVQGGQRRDPQPRVGRS